MLPLIPAGLRATTFCAGGLFGTADKPETGALVDVLSQPVSTAIVRANPVSRADRYHFFVMFPIPPYECVG